MRENSSMLLLAAMLFFATSCLSDNYLREEESPIEREETADVVLRVRTPEGFAGTGRTRSTLEDLFNEGRNLSFNHENYISDIRVLVFDNQDRLVGVRAGRLREGDNDFVTPGFTPSPNYPFSGIGHFEVTLLASTSATDLFRLVVIANAGEIVSTQLATGWQGLSYTATMERLHAPITGKMFQGGNNTYIPMWGQTLPLHIAEGTTIQDPVQLHRSVARIDVGVGAIRDNSQNVTDHVWTGLDPNGELIPFELRSVHVVRPNNRFGVAPHANRQPLPELEGRPSLPPGVRSFYFTNPNGTLHADFTRFHFTAPVAAASEINNHGAFRRQIYVPEADIIAPFNRTAAAQPRSGDANHLYRMALVVGGRYRNSPHNYYYRVDFVSGDRLVNVLRNHLYQVSIRGVRGPGERCPGDAYRSLAMNMVVQIHEWAQVSEEVIFDGINWIRLNHTRNELLSRHAILYRAANTVDELLFETTIPLGEWDLNPTNYGLIPEGVTIPLPNNSTYHSYFYDASGVRNTVLQKVSNGRFLVEFICTGPSAETATYNRPIHTGFFRFTSLVAYDEEPTVGNRPRTATLTAEAGLMVGGSRGIRFPIYITQRGDDPNDWIQGPCTGVCLGDCNCP